MNSDSSQPNSNGEVNEQITVEANAADSTAVNPGDETNQTSAQGNAGASDSAQIKSLKAQLDERSSQYMRIAADFENYRKRTLKEKDDLELQVKRNTITELLPIIDNFERARAQIKPQNDGEMGIHKSYQGVYKQLVDCLKRLGVSPMRPEGQEFDPNEHEAVMREPTDEYPEGTVLEELVRGYFLGDRVLRHAMVKVAAQKEDTSSDSQSGEVNAVE
ncbi:MAG: nucleotide exchange factor GrpE [Cyanobacteria bacterium P01_C01_bin.38]